MISTTPSLVPPIGGAAALLAFSLLPLRRRRVGRYEAAVFRSVNTLPDALHPAVWLVMQSGALGAVPVAAGVAAFAGRRPLALRLGLSGAAAYYLGKAVKLVIRRGRPADLLPDVAIRGRAAGGHGYLSGHAAVSMALASAAAPLGPGIARGTRALALGAGLGRMYVGAHLPLDVVGGAAVGSLANAAVARAVGCP